MSGLTGKRLTFLRALVEAAEYRTDVGVDPCEIAKSLGIESEEEGRLENWLEDRGYIEGMTVAWIKITAFAADTIEDLDADAAAAMTEGEATMALDPKKVFIIYGRNVKAYEAMRDFVRSLGLEPSDFNRLVEARGGSPYVGQVIGESMKEAQAMVAIFTPDERASLRQEYRSEHDRPDDQERWQSRPNVLLEAGMALAIDDKRTILVTMGRVSLSSDVDGRHVIRMSNQTEARDVMRKRLEAVGCAVHEASDWIKQGDFDGAVAGLTYDDAAPPSIPATPQVPASMSDETGKMKLVLWLKSQGSAVASGTPVELARIDQEAGVPDGMAERLLSDREVLGERWNILKQSGGYVVLERSAARVRDVLGGSGRFGCGRI